MGGQNPVIAIEEAVYRGWNLASHEGLNLWTWHSLMADLSFAVVGTVDDVSTMVAERGAGPWDRIVLSEHVWIQ